MRKKNGHPVSDSFPDKVFNVTITIITFIFIILCAYPLIYVVSASFSDPMDIFAGKCHRSSNKKRKDIGKDIVNLYSLCFCLFYFGKDTYETKKKHI